MPDYSTFLGKNNVCNASPLTKITKIGVVKLPVTSATRLLIVVGKVMLLMIFSILHQLESLTVQNR